MSMPTENQREDLPLYRTERIIASLTVSWVIALTTFMLFQESALSYTSVYFLKIILALSGAVMLATLPGFFDISYNMSGFTVRAAGGAAAFVFIYTQSPNIPALQAETPPASPTVERGEKQGNIYHLSPKGDGYPVLFALAISPASFAPPQYYYTASSAHAHQNGSWFPAQSGRQDGISIGSAIARDMSAMASAVYAALKQMLLQAKSLLDAAAFEIRGAVESFISSAMSLLGLQLDAKGLQAVNLYSEELPETVESLAGALTEPDSGVTDPLITAVEGVNGFAVNTLEIALTSVVSVVDNLDSVVTLTDKTTTALISGVQDTTGHVWQVTKVLTGQTVAPGGVTGTLSEPVTDLTGSIGSTTQTLTTPVLSTTTDTTGGVLDRVKSGFSTITNTINEISPAIVSRLDPNFPATVKLEGVLTNKPGQGLVPVAGQLTSAIPPLGAEGLGAVNSLDGVFSDEQALLLSGKGPLPKADQGFEPVCVSGCDGGALQQVLQRRQAPLFGGLKQGSRIGAVISGDSGPVGGALNGALSPLGGGNNGSGPEGGGGVLSSTVKSTGSVVGKVLK